MFIAALFFVLKVCKQPKCSSAHEWILKIPYMMDCHSGKKKIMKFLGERIKLEKITWSKVT